MSISNIAREYIEYYSRVRIAEERVHDPLVVRGIDRPFDDDGIHSQSWELQHESGKREDHCFWRVRC
jgi:hypothetical protein